MELSAWIILIAFLSRVFLADSCCSFGRSISSSSSEAGVIGATATVSTGGGLETRARVRLAMLSDGPGSILLTRFTANAIEGGASGVKVIDDEVLSEDDNSINDVSARLEALEWRVCWRPWSGVCVHTVEATVQPLSLPPQMNLHIIPSGDDRSVLKLCDAPHPAPMSLKYLGVGPIVLRIPDLQAFIFTPGDNPPIPQHRSAKHRPGVLYSVSFGLLVLHDAGTPARLEAPEPEGSVE
jgi:hypothetical protein